MGANNYPTITDAEGFFRQSEKRLAHQERRPMVKQASDILGPGIAPYAVQINHWNGDEATFNGTFWTEPGDTGAPDLTHWWIGQTEAGPDGFGIQQVMTFHDSVLFPPITRRRQFFDPGNGNINYSQWVSQHHIAIGDSATSQGNNGGIGAWSLNGDGTGNISGLTNDQPFMRRSRDVNEGCADGDTAVEGWNNVIHDPGTEWVYDDGPGTFTNIGRPGFWLMSAVVKLLNTDEAPYVARLYLDRNGATVGTGATGESDAGSDTYLQVIAPVSVSLGAAITVRINFQGAGGAGTMLADTNDSIIVFKRMSD